MTAVPLIPFFLNGPVANNESVVAGYPAGFVQADFTGSDASPTGQVAVDGNDVFYEEDDEVDFNYGASSITIANHSGVAWPLGARIIAQAAFATPAESTGSSGTLTAAQWVSLAEEAAADAGLVGDYAAATSVALQSMDEGDRGDLGEALIEPLEVIPSVSTFQVWRDGGGESSFWPAALEASLNAYQVWADSTTLTLDFGDAAEPTIDEGMARSLKHQVNTGATCSVDFDGISGALIGQTIKVRWVMDAAASVTVAIATGNGVTVTHADDIENPGIGASIDDWLEAEVFLASATSAIVMGYEKSDVTDAPLEPSATTGAISIAFTRRRNECEFTPSGNITDIDPSALALYQTGVIHFVITTQRTLAFVHSGLTFICPLSTGWSSGTFTPTANRSYECAIRRKAASTYVVTMGEALA